MGWLTPLYGKTVGLDSAPLIYFIEKHPIFHARVRPFFQAAQRGDFKVVTSTITLTEVLVHPIRKGNFSLAATFRDILLNAEHIQTIPVSAEIAGVASALRAEHKKLRTPDAIQMATAITRKADFFLTNDSSLPAIPHLAVLVLEKQVT